MSFLPFSYTIPLKYERQRKQWLDRGCTHQARQSYDRQRVFLPDTNSGDFWDEQFALQQGYFPMEKWRIRTVISLLNERQSVLNLGVGSGRLEAELRLHKPNISYTGTDITDTTLQKLRRVFSDWRFVQSTLTALPFADNEFEQILLLEVLEHIKPNQTFAVLEEVYRILKPGGKFVISVPINEGLEAMLPHNPNSHMRLYSPQLLTFELRYTGFKVEKMWWASAFSRWFGIKHWFNQWLYLRPANNIILVCHKP